MNPSTTEKKEIKKMTENIVNYVVLGKCPDCKGKDLNELCISCQHINGIPYKEIIEKGWSKEEVLIIAKERKLN